MNDISQELWTAFNDIYFVESTHSYTDSLNTKFTSVTAFVSRFVRKMTDEEWATIAQRCIDSKSNKNEKYNGKTVNEVREMWNKSGEYARVLGTEVHLVMEHLWQNKDYAGNTELMKNYDGMLEDFAARKQYCRTLFEKMKKFYIPVKNEFIVYDVDNALCGTIDFFAYNVKKDCYSIIDWKTSKSFDMTNNYHEKLLYPMQDFDACNVNEYSIQLSTYAWILEKHCPSIKIGEMVLFQIPNSSTAPVIANCNDMRQYLNKILK